MIGYKLIIINDEKYHDENSDIEDEIDKSIFFEINSYDREENEITNTTRQNLPTMRR